MKKKVVEIPEKYITLAKEANKINPLKVKVPLKINEWTILNDVKTFLDSCITTMLNPQTSNDVREEQYDQIQEFLNILPKPKTKIK